MSTYYDFKTESWLSISSMSNSTFDLCKRPSCGRIVNVRMMVKTAFALQLFILLWAGTSRPIIWNKNLRSLCVSAGWMYILTLGKDRPIRTSSRLDVVYWICQGLPSDILSIYIIIYFNGQYWLYTWYFIVYVKKFGGFFNICCSFTHL